MLMNLQYTIPPLDPIFWLRYTVSVWLSLWACSYEPLSLLALNVVNSTLVYWTIMNVIDLVFCFSYYILTCDLFWCSFSSRLTFFFCEALCIWVLLTQFIVVDERCRYYGSLWCISKNPFVYLTIVVMSKIIRNILFFLNFQLTHFLVPLLIWFDNYGFQSCMCYVYVWDFKTV